MIDQKAVQARAVQEMRAKTMMQGRKMVHDHIYQKVNERTPELWQRAGHWILPMWYDMAWITVLRFLLATAKTIWHVLRFLTLFPLQRRIAQIVARGGHTARIAQGENERTVKITISKWFTPVYSCEMDVINGRVKNEFALTGKIKHDKNTL
jgi:hypothetical protein